MPALEEILYSGYVATGQAVYDFEDKFKAYIGNQNIISVHSGTDALHLAYILAGVKPGDEIISTPMTAEPTNTSIAMVGAKVVWGDVDPANGLLDPKSVRELITEKTKAIVLVHYAGMVCDMDEYVKISEGRNGKQSSGKSDGLDSLLDDMDSKFSALFGDDYGAFSEDEKGNNTDFYDNENYDEEELYNITDDVVRILKESSKRGIFNMAIYDSVISACSIREIRLEYFKHKMSFILGRDDCMTYYGRANLMATMKPDSDLAAYYDGRSLIKFKPFVLNKKEGRQNW